MTDRSFSPRATRWLVVVGLVSLAASGFLATIGREVFELSSFGNDGFSRSALGHRAYLELLRGLGFQVVLSRHATAAKAQDASVVVVAEPDLGEQGPRPAILADILQRAPRVLLVLPKRTGAPAEAQPRWIAAAGLRPVVDAQRVLDEALEGARVVRPQSSIGRWTGPLPGPAIESPQLMTASGLAPLVANDAGMLAGEKRDDRHHLIVLSDPDVLATHGLGRGDNAVLAVRLLERLGAGERLVLVDETLHGHDLQPSIARELFRFPLALATFQAILVAALLAWTASVRFGRPRREAEQLDDRQSSLLESAAGLLAHCGHAGTALAAYWRAAKEQVAQALRAPGERSDVPERWVRTLAAARGRGDTLEALDRRVSDLQRRHRAEHEALRTAADIHRWREEMTDGSGRDP